MKSSLFRVFSSRRPLMHGCAAVLLATLAAACVGTQRGAYLKTDALPPGAKPITLHIATTRERSGDDTGELFTGNRARNLDFARMVVSIPPDHKIGEIEWASSGSADPSKHFAVVSHRYGTGKEILESVKREVASRAPADREILVFVHGYNTSFDDSLFRMAQITTDSGFRGVPVLFTWPSRAKLTSYPYDRESAIYSRDDLEMALDALATHSGARRINILAHSMGNMLTLEALRQAQIRGRGTLGGKLGEIMLAAPDVDLDVFRRQIEVIADKNRSVTVFVSKDDRALAVSRRFWGSERARAGASDAVEIMAEAGTKIPGLRVVDLSALKDQLPHSRFATSPEVVKLIGRQVASHDHRPPTLGERLTDLSDDVVDKVGAAAGTAAKLPIGIVGGVVDGVSGAAGKVAP